MPLLRETNQLSPPPPPHSHPGHHQRPSLANRYCPFCKSQQLQYISNTPDFKHDSSTSSRGNHSKNSSKMDSMERNKQGNVTLGFEVTNDTETITQATNTEEAPNRRERSSAFAEESQGERGGWDDLERAHSYSTVPTAPPQLPSDVVSHSETTSDLPGVGEQEQQYSISSWSYSEISGHQPPPQSFLRSSHDVLYHSRDHVGVEYPRQDSGDIDDSSTSYSQDTTDFRHNTKSNTQSTHGAQNRQKQKYNTAPTGGSAKASDLSRSGGKSGRLTSSEPTPKLQPFPEGAPGRGNTNTPIGELRRFSSHDTAHFQQRTPFHDQGSRSYTDTTSSRMRIPRASLGSVQEQPTAPKSLNPFDESYCSTNPFDMEDSTTSNPFGAEDDEDEPVSVEKVKEQRDGDGWGEIKPNERPRGFSQHEERYFPDFHQSQRKESRGSSKDDTDFDTPRVSTHQVPPPSSSVPASSFMSGLPAHMSFRSTPRDSHNVSKKSSTLPYGSRSPRVTQESPEFTKRTRTTLPRGKPPIPGMLVRGKSMESLQQSSQKNEHHPNKSNRIVSPGSRRRWDDPYGGDNPSGGRGSNNGGKGHRNGSMSPSGHNGSNGSSGSGKSTPEVTRRGHSSSDTQSTGRGQFYLHHYFTIAVHLEY